MPVNLTDEQKEVLREFAHLERDTPGTITGVEKSSFRNFRMRKPSSEQQGASDNYSDKTSEPREQSSQGDKLAGGVAKQSNSKSQ